MENIGGALAFKATLDIDDFKVSSEAMNRYIKNASNNAIVEADRMEQSFLTLRKRGKVYRFLPCWARNDEPCSEHCASAWAVPAT